jgi:hypothetical protein
MHGPRIALAILMIPVTLRAATTVDQIVVSVGNVGITRNEVDQEVRFAHFLDGQPREGKPSEAQWLAARDRLVEQTLLAEEAEADPMDPASLEQEATRLLEEVKKLYPSEAVYREALATTGYNEDQVFQRLRRNVQILRLINRRLRPNAGADRREIEAYYNETFLPEFARRGEATPPRLEEVETVIRETLTQQKVDQLLDQWLKQIQGARRVKIHQ